MNFDENEAGMNATRMNMDDEYEGGQWIDGEFYASSSKPKFHQSKEDAIYGVFSEEYDDRSTRGKGRGRNKKDADHSRADSLMQGGAVKFVSSGKIEGSKPPPAVAEPLPWDKKARAEQKDAADAKEEAKKPELVVPVYVAPKPPPVRKVIDKDFGKFEKHTKGFGMRMLLKNGFKGRLGKNEQGLVNPVQPKLRPKGMGMGFNNFSEINEKNLELRNNVEEEAKKAAKEAQAAKKEEVVYESREANWKKGGGKKKKTVYKTANDVTAASEVVNPVNSKYQIVDMRGPSVKILSSSSSDQLSTARDDDDGPGWTPTAEGASMHLPELRHNLRLLVEMTEEDITTINRDMSLARDRVGSMKKKRDTMQAVCKREKENIQNVEDVLKLLEKCQERLAELGLGGRVADRLDAVGDTLDLLKHKYPDEFKAFGVASLAEPLAFPLMKAYFHDWSPLRVTAATAPAGAAAAGRTDDWQEVLRTWKSLLSGERFLGVQGGDDVYRALLDNTVVPMLHLTLASTWSPREYAPCIQLLTKLQSLFPKALYDQVRSQAVAPRLKQAAEAWSPRADTVPVHTWIEPWAQVLEEEDLQPVYTVVRYKLAIALQSWHPSDGSAMVVLSPWQGLWRGKDFETMLARSVLPLLHKMLKTEFVVNPHQQYVDPFTWLMSWAPLMPTRVMVQLLKMEFFPKWFEALYAWLNANPDFDELSRWYKGWKSMFAQTLRDDPMVKQFFSRGLDLLNASLMDPDTLPSLINDIRAELRTPTPTPATAAPTAASKSGFASMGGPAFAPQPTARAPMPQDTSEISFSELIAQFALTNAVDFAPNIQRALVDGKQVYSFGRTNVYLDNRTVYASRQDPVSKMWSWAPINLTDLLAGCH